MKEHSEKIPSPVEKGVAKVPVVMQLEALECGAASLAMVLAYYGKWIPLEKVRLDCGVSRDGSNARSLLQAARSYGLKAAGYKLEPEDLKKEGKFPCIIHWNFNHFVVLNGFRKGKAYINDPARGTCEIPEKQFDESFTGICLMFEPTEDFHPEGKKKSVLGFVRKRMKGAMGAVVFIVLTTLISSLLSIIKPGFTRIFMDRLLTGVNPDWLYPVITGLAILSAVELLVAWVQAVYALRFSGKLAVIGNSTYMWHVLRLPMEFFSQRMAGDIQQRQATNAQIAQTLVNTFAPLVLHAAMAVFYLVVMIRYSLMLTAVGLLAIVINIFMSRIISAKRVNISRVTMRDQGKLYGATVSGIEMIETIKASGAENGYFSNWAGYQANVNSGNIRFQILNSYLGLLPNIVSTLSGTIVTLLGVMLILQGKFMIGMVSVFQGYLSSFTSPASELISAGQMIQEMRTDMERIEDVMEYPVQVPDETDPLPDNKDQLPDKTDPLPDKTDRLPGGTSGKNEESIARSYEKLKGEVELKNVTFGYSRLGQPLIRDFSMKLKPGSRVAFVGASGCGKSTLSKLISGLYEPWSGEILFDGKPRSEIDRSVFTGSLSVVDQDIILFEDTIANNIRMWDNSIEDFEVIMAARDAQVHDDIMKREGGYQYRIAEGGKDFSGGQRQRLEIARVLASDPHIIIMDEATSALDAKTEYNVVNAIRDRGITCIVVAHRLSTIRDCDEIIVLDHGCVVERGTHEQLIAQNGYYTQLVSNE